MSWNKRYKEMKKGMGWTNADVANITGHSESTLKSTTSPKAKFSRCMKLAVIVYEKLKPINNAD
jgi:hypothetical protein